jgi:hypothetical protein
LKHFFFNSQKKKKQINKNKFFLNFRYLKLRKNHFSYKFNKFINSNISTKIRPAIKFNKFNSRSNFIIKFKKGANFIRFNKIRTFLKSNSFLAYKRVKFNKVNNFFGTKVFPSLQLAENDYCSSLKKNKFSLYSKLYKKNEGLSVSQPRIKKNLNLISKKIQLNLNFFSYNFFFSRAFCFFFKNLLVNSVKFKLGLK